MEEGKPKRERRQRRRFSDEYKASTVKLVLSGRKTAGQVARDLDLTETAVRHWVKQAQVDAGKGPGGALTTAEKEEFAKLRKEVRELKMEREILVKAAAFFAKNPERLTSGAGSSTAARGSTRISSPRRSS